MAIHLENGHTDSVLSADCCKDSCGHIVTGSEGGQLCLWNEDGTLLGMFAGVVQNAFILHRIQQQILVLVSLQDDYYPGVS